MNRDIDKLAAPTSPQSTAGQTTHPDMPDNEILARLLALNQARAAGT